jgi:alcohol dehydrogenase
MLKENDCDSVISLGGGSPHDCAKGIALVAANGGDIRDYEGVDRSAKPQLPMIAINTTAGTASEMTRFCIITDEVRHIKMAIVDKHVTPLLSVNDSSLMVGMPKSLTAATGMDALTHAIEAYVSIAATPITDACALKAVTMIAENLPVAVEDGSNAQAREAMAYAQFLAGMAFNNASLAMCMRWRTSWVASTICHTVYVMPCCCRMFRYLIAKLLPPACATAPRQWA